MSRRTTRCLTWGETKRSGETLRHADGSWAGHVSWTVYVTLCGRPDDGDPGPTLAGEHPADEHRPGGVCPRCWRVYRIEMQRASCAPLDGGAS